jgi:signal recognition particle subunit SRP19
MSHARIEEVSDSDPEIDDPKEYLPHSDKNIIVPANLPPPTSSRQPPPSQPQPSFGDLPQGLRPQSANTGPKFDRSTVKHYQTLYPIYFDASRSKAQGRRVQKSLAVLNPLARSLLDAVQSASGSTPLRIAFEPDKTHPKDWSNPGRVRVQLFHKDTHAPLHPTIKNKSHLYILVAKYLRQHPTTSTDPLKLPIEGLPTTKPEHLVPPAKPRGWKMNDVIPMHSPAMTGGGVNDNFMSDMMKELQNAQGGAGGNPMANMLGAMGGGMGGAGGGQTIEQGSSGTKRKMDMEKPRPGQGQKDKSGGGLTFGHSK